MDPGALRLEAEWAIAPDTVKQHLCALRQQQRDTAQRLKALLGQGGPLAPAAPRDADENGSPPAATRPSLDDAYRSGELHRLIADLEGDPLPEGAHPVLGRLTPGAAMSPAARARSGAAPSGPVRRALPVQVPLINSVAAGYPTAFTDLGYPARAADEHVRAPDLDDPDAFAATIVGDSMAPDYRAGDIVVFSPARPIRSGADCFVRLERDDEMTFKRVLLEGPDPDAPTHVRLIPLNPAYPTRLYPRESIAFMCAAVSVTRPLP
jgi:SOS-response transcriptional repressor LexA